MDLAEELRSKGLKVTPQRLAVLRVVSSGGHYTGEQIYEMLKKSEPGISLSTIYNSLEALRESGLLNSFEARGVTWYEFRKEPHANVICLDTGEIVDVDVDLSQLTSSIDSKGMRTRGVNLVVYAECRPNETAPQGGADGR
ncbi:Fur family transcriptional regulator [Sulfodiicoccus acidiphilus]|nr:Fur family transcriptional regulator [Sulfodiicoccus acidiphilus]